MKRAVSTSRPLALVIPWFGRDLKGGAEQQAWQIATRLAARGHKLEVLTTCCASFLEDWAENHLPQGMQTDSGGFTIRRFRVDARNRSAFDALNAALLSLPASALRPGVSPVSHEQAAVWTHHNINSSQLEHYLKSSREKYHAFVFMPYLYGITLNGLPWVAERAWLQPCLHDEAYAYLPDVARIFQKSHDLLFNSSGEQQLAARLYGPMIWEKSVVTGEGIEAFELPGSNAHSSTLPFGTQPFVLCLGRRDPAKGTDRICAAFRLHKRRHPSSPLRLVLAGPGSRAYGEDATGIIDLGLVSESMKTALLQSCLALFQPSTNESFSRVLFESWACGKPVVAHRNCLATAMAVSDSRGGWLAGEEEEWARQITEIERMPEDALSTAGRNGLAYARKYADWNEVIGRYEQTLGLTPARGPDKHGLEPQRFRKLKAIHQILPNLSYGDAISNEARFIRDRLREMGYRSEILVCHIDRRVADQCHPYKPGRLHPKDGLIYHHSIGSAITSIAVAHAGPKCLIYHNITPEGFFEPYRPDHARILRDGREQMWSLAASFRHSVGVSAYNAEELKIFGFAHPGVLPLSIDPGQWNEPPDEELMARLQDGRHNILFVGRYAPNKCQHDLVKAFRHYLSFDREARLILVGSYEPTDPYYIHLCDTAARWGVRDRVVLPGHITGAQLQAYYRCAHLFWSMSEHEGFCVPLIEAMWFDVPILAYRSSAIPETLANAGALFRDKSKLEILAGQAFELIHDPDLRLKILSGQRERRKDFLPEAVKVHLQHLVTCIEEY